MVAKMPNKVVPHHSHIFQNWRYRCNFSAPGHQDNFPQKQSGPEQILSENGVKKIKILVDAHVLDFSFQGTSTYIIGLYNSLVRYDNIEITLCASDLEKLKQQFQDPRFRFIRLKSTSSLTRLLWEFPSIISKHDFDFCHFQYIIPFFGLKSRIINTVHDVLFLDYPQFFPSSYRIVKGRLFEFSARRSDLVLTVSEYSKEALMRHFNLRSEKVKITPNAVNPSVEYIMEEPEFKEKYGLGKYILYVSRFEPRKNHESLLRAYLDLKLHESGYSLLFIGSKKEKIEYQAYQNLVSQIPAELTDKVVFLENLASSELDCFYAYADCFVYPSYVEGFGIPPIEAAIHGTKVLCSNTTSMADFSFFRYTFNPNNFRELKEKLSLLLADADYPYEKIKQEITATYNWDAIAARYYTELGVVK